MADWPTEPADIVREALRDYVGDGEGADEAILAAYEAELRERIAQDIEADRTPAPWNEERREESVGHWLDSRDATKAARIARGATR